MNPSPGNWKERSEEKYRALFECTGDAIVMSTFEGRVLDANPSAVALFGYTREELAEMNVERLFADPSESLVLRSAVEAGGSVNDFGLTLRRKDGSEFPALLAGGLWRDVDGTPLGYQAIVRDVTSQKLARRALQRDHDELEERVAERTEELTRANARLQEQITECSIAEEKLKKAHRELNQIIEFLPDPTYVIDRRGRVTAWNRALAELTGIEAERIIGKGDYEYARPFHGQRQPVLIDLVIDYDESAASRYDSVKREGDQLISEMVLPDFHGRGPAWVWNVAAPLYDEGGQVVGAIEAIRDITGLKRVEERLRESRELFAKFMDVLPHGAFVKDESSKVIYVNQFVKDLFGGDHWIGKDAHAAFPDNPGTAEAMHADDRRALEEGITTAEEAMPDKNGEMHVFQTTKFRISRANKSPLLGGIGLDVTERVRAREELRLSEERYRTLYRKARETEELYHSLLDSTLDPIVTYDLEGGVSYVNSAFTETFGWAREELAAGVPYTPESEREITMANVRRVIHDGVPLKNFETTRMTKSGGRIHVNISASRFNDHEGKPAGMVVILRDVTERKHAEMLLHRAKEEAEAATRAKSEFLANMSHEIRTPMNAIIGLSHLALKTDMSPRQADYQEKIHTSANSLLRLIDDILDFSKVEAGKLDLENRPFSLAEVVERLTSIFHVKSVEKGLAFSVDVDESAPMRLIGDSLRLEQVLTNLTSNAIKFTREGGVFVRIERVDESGEKATLRFSVRDTGIGMNREQAERIFRPFHQADASVTRKYGGTGLGLAISRRLIEMMGGEIEVRSEPCGGAEFSFTLHFGKTNELPPASMGVSEDRVRELLSGRRVLMVEDNEINRQVAGELLESVGVETASAVNGKTAVELVEKERFDAVLMDVHMPVMDGLTAAGKIREGPAPPDLPILAMTANAMAGDREECLEAGMNDHIAKPIEPAKLYETLIRWIRPDAVPSLSRDSTPPPAPASVGAAGDFPAVDGVDTAAGLFYMNGDRELYRKVLANMYDKHRGVAGEIRSKMDERDLAAARRLAHTIKSVAGSIGAGGLQTRARALETAIRSKDPEAIPNAMSAFSEEAARVMTALEPLARRADPPAPDEAESVDESGPPDADRLKAAFEELSGLIDEGASEAMDLVEEIKDLLGSSGRVDDFRMLESQIDDYEFEDARETLKRLFERLLGASVP